MSTLKVNNLQVGQHATATNNFTLYQPAVPDGTVRLGYGNVGSVTDSLTFTNTGRLGIGTTNPDSLLHLKSTSGNVRHTIEVPDTFQAFTNYSAANSEFSIGYIRNSGSDHSFRFCAADGLSSGEILRIDSVNQRVGIGVTNPSYKLDVNGVVGSSTFISTSYSVFASIVAADPGSNYYSWNNRIGGGLAVVGTTYLDGNVGIGTTNPSTKLHVHNGEFSLKSASGVFPAAFKATSKEFSNISTTYVSFDHSINVGGNSGFDMVSIETVGDHQASFMFTTGRQNAIAHKYTHFAPVCCSVTEVSEGTFDIVIDGDARTYTLQFSVSALSISPNFKASSATSGITTVAILFFQFPSI